MNFRRALGFSSFILFAGMALHADSTPLAQPPVRCAETMVPPPAPRSCRDPQDDREEEYCKAMEHVQDAIEDQNAFEGHEGTLDVYWMTVQGGKNTTAKINAIYEGANIEGMPPQILAGALKQESLMADIGLIDDGGNYSCGIGQMNLQEWCNWAQSLDSSKQSQIGWPGAELSAYATALGMASPCSKPLAIPSVAAPFLESAKARMKSERRHVLLMEMRHLQNLPQSEIYSKLPGADDEIKRLQMKMGKSFVENCMDTRKGILGKAHELSDIFHTQVPKALQDVQHYRSGERFQRTCKQTATTDAYPLHTGWLLADAMYNAGPQIMGLIAHYRKLDRSGIANPENWKDFGPQDLVNALYWGGKFVPGSDADPKGGKIEYISTSGEKRQMGYFKTCVVQRHMSRVINQSANSGVTIARSQEGDKGCSPKAGNVPEKRKSSSGVQK